MAVAEDPQLESERRVEPTRAELRVLDGSTANLMRQLLLAVGAMFSAFAAARGVSSLLHLRHGAPAFFAEGVLLVGFGCVTIFLTSAMPIRRALDAQGRSIERNERRLQAEAARHLLASQMQDALEMSSVEADAVDVVSRAFDEIADRPARLLLADSSRAHLHEAAVGSAVDGPGCGVETPWDCPAVRRGQTLHFESSDGLSACPRLRGRGTPCSATCVPVTVLGTPMGVMQMTGSPHDQLSADQLSQLESLAQQAGSRIGVLRAMASSQLQAATDPLTGAVNRRRLEDRFHELRRTETPYALLLCDLDHFKTLNDTHGHETGDRALRLFVDVLDAAVGAGDTVCRYGGEEFVVLLAGFDRYRAAALAEGLRASLATSLERGEVPRFSASFGAADSSQAETPDRVVRLADLAMFDAKHAGRDRVVVAETTVLTTGTEPAVAVRDPARLAAVPTDSAVVQLPSGR